MEAVAREGIDYPERDGKPVGETDFHISVIFYLRQVLQLHFRREPRVYIAANMFLYYEEGNPSAMVAPDVFVVRGVDKHKRRTFKLWEEKVAPCVVVEVTSMSSRIEDLGTKRAVYELLGVHEYFVFDPLQEYAKQPLQGFRLLGDQYRKLAPSRDGSLRSAELGLILQPRGDVLRLVIAKTGEVLPEMDEVVDRLAVEQQRAASEAQRADKEARRARAEATRAARAEREVARLRARLARLNK